MRGTANKVFVVGNKKKVKALEDEKTKISLSLTKALSDISNLKKEIATKRR